MKRFRFRWATVARRETPGSTKRVRHEPCDLDDKRNRRAFAEGTYLDAMEGRLPPSIFCPIGQTPMVDPIIASDGHSYERKHLQRWLQTRDKSPMTGGTLDGSITIPNHTLRNVIGECIASLSCDSSRKRRQFFPLWKRRDRRAPRCPAASHDVQN